MGVRLPILVTVSNPDALVLCGVCEALPPVARAQRRGEVMMRMLDDAIRERPRRHG